ncbi:MAG: PAS domain S-box protein [Hyphomicrobium sp.]|jgi:PAS domain S-box-containing protein
MHKDAERAETPLKLALDIAAVGVWAWESATDEITADAAYRQLYGFSADVTLDSAAWLERLHPDDRDALKRHVDASLRIEDEWHEEFRVLHPDRGERWLEGIGHVVRDASERVTGLAGINTDITARKRAEIALRESEARLRAIIDNAIDGIIAIDERGEVQSVNPAVERIFGYSSQDVIGQNVRLLMPEPYWSGHDTYIRDYLKTGQAKIIGIGREVVGRRKNGSTFPLDLGITEVSQGARRLFIGFVRDITERKQSEDTQRLLLREINHRVKNTLVIVQAMAEQTMRKSRDPSHFVDSFRGRLHALSRAHNMLTQENWTGVNLQSLIRDQLLIGSEQDQRISCSGPPIDLQPRAAVHLGLVLHELGTNAHKYGALKVPEGRLAVTWRIATQRAGRSLELIWKETDGPEVGPPGVEGFGTFLIQRGLKHALGGDASVAFAPSGVVCTLESFRL